MAKVIPVLKKENENDPNDYRPISILPVFSKILEKVMHSQLYAFIESKNLLAHSQFGFRKGVFTQDAVLSLLDHLTESIERNKYSVVFLWIYLKLLIAYPTKYW